MAAIKICNDARKHFKEILNTGMVDALNALRDEDRKQLEDILNDEQIWKNSEKEPYEISFFLGLRRGTYNLIYEQFLYNNYLYFVPGIHDTNQKKLLVMNLFDSERRKFERLQNKFSKNHETRYERPRIPEKVRVDVWRRDKGCCAQCGSRDKLEYDHIIPISKGGSNTARNIELLCEECNRRKRDKIQ
ncbi:MAG TPA: HNH endonuclease signature motif containing protein [bacterium]|nr:HNH endonuclease signature motif containing protein [bacterium]